MDTLDFLDLLYSQWAKTTGAADMYWMPEEVAELYDGFRISAVNEKQEKETVAANLTEADADFLTAAHGCIPDLIRRLHEAIDESDRLDTEKDELVCRIAQLEIEADERERVITDLEAQLANPEDR